MKKKLTAMFRDKDNDGAVNLTSDPDDKDLVLVDVNGMAKIVVKIGELKEAIQEIEKFNGVPFGVQSVFSNKDGEVALQGGLNVIERTSGFCHVESAPTISEPYSITVSSTTGMSDEDLERSMICEIPEVVEKAKIKREKK